MKAQSIICVSLWAVESDRLVCVAAGDKAFGMSLNSLPLIFASNLIPKPSLRSNPMTGRVLRVLKRVEWF